VLALLAALTRETGLLLVAALVVDRLLRRDWRQAAWFASSGIPAIAWYGYLAARLPPDGPALMFGIPVWGILRRLLWLRPFPDPLVQLLMRITDFLAVLGLAISMILAVRWLLERRLAPATLCVGFFAALAVVLCSPSHMIEAFGFGRPVSPLLLWVMVEAVSRKKWIALAPPLLVSLSVSMAFARPFLTVMQSLLGR
jgi:hypothetical protein